MDDTLRITRRRTLAAGALWGAGVVVAGCVTTDQDPRPTPHQERTMQTDVAIVGGGPAGLSAALALGRARKRVVLFDAGPRRNARASEMHNFVSRDGTPPEEFRRVARAQLAPYDSVVVRDVVVDRVAGSRGAFVVEGGGETFEARRILLCTGLIDDGLPLEGFAEFWGHGVVQCPYCHGWESRDRPWGFLARPEHAAHLPMFALQLRGWTRDVTVFTNDAFTMPDDMRRLLEAGGLRIETARIEKLVGRDGHLEGLQLAGGGRVPCALLFAHPPQRQVPLVQGLGVGLDDDGFVQVDAMRRETSVPGIFAAGDLTTRMQAAIAAAASGMQAAAMINVELAMEAAA